MLGKLNISRILSAAICLISLTVLQAVKTLHIALEHHSISVCDCKDLHSSSHFHKAPGSDTHDCSICQINISSFVLFTYSPDLFVVKSFFKTNFGVETATLKDGYDTYLHPRGPPNQV